MRVCHTPTSHTQDVKQDLGPHQSENDHFGALDDLNLKKVSGRIRIRIRINLKRYDSSINKQKNEEKL